MRFMMLLSRIATEAVGERDYFLSVLEEPLIINGIRIICVLLLFFFIGSYLKYRKKR